MLRVLGYVLCDINNKVKVKGKKKPGYLRWCTIDCSLVLFVPAVVTHSVIL